jgi:hypothetical protein
LFELKAQVHPSVCSYDYKLFIFLTSSLKQLGEMTSTKFGTNNPLVKGIQVVFK